MINKAVKCPGDARQDWKIIQDIAGALGRPKGFSFGTPRDIFNELRRATKGGIADSSGISYEKVEAQNGVFWPCSKRERSSRHAALVRAGLVEPCGQRRRPVLFPRRQSALQRRRLFVGPVEEVGEEYPIFLTTGRVISQFLSGTQTGRMGRSWINIPNREWKCIRDSLKNSALSTANGGRRNAARGNDAARDGRHTIRPDTMFVPYHWPDEKSINRLTIAAQDPISKIPAVQGVRMPRPQGGRGAGVRGSARAAAVTTKTRKHEDERPCLNRPI